MAVMDYAQWLKYQGIGSSAAARDRFWAYRAAHGAPIPGSPQAPNAPAPAPPPEPAPYTPPPPPPPPVIDWNTLYNNHDAQSIAEAADLDLRYSTTANNATKAYQNWVTQNYGAQAIGPDGKFDPTKATGGMVARINRDTDLGVERQQNAAAARNMYRSGNRLVNEGKERAAGADKLTDLSNERENQQFGMDSTIGQAQMERDIGKNTAYRASAQRGIDDAWRKWQAGIG